MKEIKKFINLVLSSYGLQFTIIASLISIAFYKVLNFSFHANREIGFLLGITGGDFSIINLIKSHGFISLLNYKLFGPNPWGWYLTGIILHILATCMLIVLISKLTKNRLIGFLTGLWFGVSLSWHDVITFGSQESMYAAQLFLFFVSVWFYRKFREGVNAKINYSIAFVVLFITLPLRELGLVFYPLLFLFDVILHWRFDIRKQLKQNVVSFLQFIIPQIPFILMAIAYFIFAKTYGETPHYFADERVKFQHNLLSEKRYLEYLFISFTSFGTYLPPLFIPFPLLNLVRDIVFSFIPIHIVKVYFFSVVGYFFYAILWFLTLREKGKPYFRLLLFCLAIISVPTFFYSTAVSMDQNLFLRDYYNDENRWRYFAFAGTSLFIIIYALKVVSNKVSHRIFKSLGIFLLIGNLFMNIFLLWRAQDQMYEEMFMTQKLFYKTFFEAFPKYEESYILYFNPQTYQLRDFIWEWYSFKNFFYKNLTDLRTNWHYTEMEKILSLVQKTPSLINDLFFIDFNLREGVVNRTEDVKRIVLSQKVAELISSEKSNSDNMFLLNVSEISPVEFPYIASLTLKADLSTIRNVERKQIDKKKLEALTLYSKSNSILRDKKVHEVCRTHGNELVFDSSHLVDGNFGVRSTWWADCLPGWFILDLGRVYEIGGFIMGGIENDSLLPRSYYYEVSIDGTTWEKVFEVTGSTRWEIMDKWPNSHKAQYIRVTVEATQKGGFVQIDEAEPVLAEAASVFDYWSSRIELTNDLHNLFVLEGLYDTQVSQSFGKLHWNTNLTKVSEDQTTFYFPFFTDGKYHTYTIPIYESEFYSLPEQFLKRRITDITLDFSSFPGTVSITNFRIDPKYQIKK